MKNRQIDKKPTMQVRIDSGLHQLLKIKAAKENRSIKQLVEESLMELLAVTPSDSELS
ncbi:MAG: toxin-antitoxin system HicB family antitoxin [Bacteroidota bacterium]